MGRNISARVAWLALSLTKRRPGLAAHIQQGLLRRRASAGADGRQVWRRSPPLQALLDHPVRQVKPHSEPGQPDMHRPYPEGVDADDVHHREGDQEDEAAGQLLPVEPGGCHPGPALRQPPLPVRGPDTGPRQDA